MIWEIYMNSGCYDSIQDMNFKKDVILEVEGVNSDSYCLSTGPFSIEIHILPVCSVCFIKQK